MLTSSSSIRGKTNKKQGKRILAYAVNAVAAVCETVNIYLLQSLVDTAGNKKFVFDLIYYLIILIMVVFIRKINSNLVDEIVRERNENTGETVLSRISKLDYCNFENREILPDIERYYSLYAEREEGYVRSINKLMYLVIRALGIELFLLTVGWKIAVAMIPLGIITYLLFAKAVDKEMEVTGNYWKYYKLQKQYSSIFTDRAFAKEMRIFNPKELLEKYWLTNMKEFHEHQLFGNLKERNLIGLFSGLEFIGVTVIILIMLKKMSFSVGTVITVAWSIWSLINDFEQETYQIIRNFKGYGDWKKTEKRILTLKQENNTGIDPGRLDEIRFENVWYRYPGEDNFAVKNLSMVIKGNKKYALIGENGCGKSTVLLLISGLIIPEKGEIYINNIPSREVNHAALRKQMGCLFQNFSRYNLSAAENIMLLPDSEDKAEQMLDHVDKHLKDKLPNGMATKIGKLEDGSVDLSGGEWQKIALARTYAENKMFLLMDEPSAALDPIAEVKAYEDMEKVLENKGGIIAVHRLGIIKSVDEVIVIKDGTLVAQGEHEKLRKENEYYETLYEAGTKWLQEK